MSGAVVDAIEYVGVFNIATAVIVSLTIFWFVRENFSTSHFKLPPGPPSIPYPFDGIMSLFSSKDRFGKLMGVAKRYGDLVYIRVGKRRLVFVSSPRMVKELLVKQADVTSNRYLPPFFNITMAYTGGILFSQGEVWQELRRFSLSALRNFGMGKRDIEQRIIQEARNLCETLAQSATSNQSQDPFEVFSFAVSNIINGITFGRRFEYDDPMFLDLIKRLRDLTSSTRVNPIIRDLINRFPVLLKAPLFRTSKENLLGLKDFINKEVDEHANTLDPNDARDIIDMYLTEVRRLEAEIGKGGETPYLTRGSLWMPVFDLFLAGTETTSSTLLWFVLLMAGHLDIQSKVAEEINHVIGRERAPSVDDRKNMPYTDATLSEVMRFRPIAAMGVPHMCSTDVEIGGYTIPQNTDIIMNILGMHLDPRFWHDPEVFNPERFLSDDGKMAVKQEAFEPFGAGRRVCLGEQLAKMELFIFTTSLLQRFRLSLPQGVGADYSFDHCHGTLVPKRYRVIFEEH